MVASAGKILQLAAQRSAELSKAVVGTEDLLWAMFQTEEHFHSRSQAVKRLEAMIAGYSSAGGARHVGRARDAAADDGRRNRDNNDRRKQDKSAALGQRSSADREGLSHSLDSLRDR